jgi:thiol-disulfide isomerase/thioredoxin
VVSSSHTIAPDGATMPLMQVNIMQSTLSSFSWRSAQAAAFALICTAAVTAQDTPKADAAPEPMTIGSAAPKPMIEKFVRGTEPKWFEPGKVYVVEFWATWCGPCRMSMPHLSDVSEKYKDSVVIVGISDEKLETVTKFLDTDEWKQKARYNLATDPDRSTYKQYMEAAAQNGIPTAFVIKDDKVQWIGHPMSMDEPLAKIVAGTWNAADYKVEFEKETAMTRQQMTRRSAMAKARKTGDWDAIIKMMDEDIAAAPSRAKASMQANKFQVLLTDAKKPADAYKLGREVAAANNDNAMILNQMAWFVLDNEKVTDRDLSFAMDVATQAVAATKGEDGAIMDTMARACWESGDKAKAIEWQKKAIENADGEMADELKETLKKYEGSTAPTKKTSFRQDGAPSATPPAAPPAVAPDATTAPRAPRPARPAAKLSPAAEKVFPAITPEGFASTDEIIAFLPNASKDPGAMLRLVRAMRSANEGGNISIRVAAALVEDMQPVVTATTMKFGKAGSMPIPVPVNGAKFEVKMDGDSAATILATDAEGKPTGQPTGVVKADGKWWFDFDKSAGMKGDEGAQMAMMANMMGETMRASIKTAAASTAKEVMDGKFKTIEEANSAFAQTMQGEMMKSMGMEGGPGGPGGPGGAMGPGGARGPGGPGAPRGPGAPMPPAGAPVPPAPPAPPAGAPTGK